MTFLTYALVPLYGGIWRSRSPFPSPAFYAAGATEHCRETEQCRTRLRLYGMVGRRIMKEHQVPHDIAYLITRWISDEETVAHTMDRLPVPDARAHNRVCRGICCIS